MDRPGDKQPPYRSTVIASFREAAAARRSFLRSMQSVSRSAGARQADFDALERKILGDSIDPSGGSS